MSATTTIDTVATTAPTTLDVPVGELARILANANLFTGDAARPAIHAVRLDITADGDMIAEATDTYALYRETFAAGASGPACSITIDSDDVSAIVKGTKPRKSAAMLPAALTITADTLTVRHCGFNFTAKATGYDWPNTASLWPSELTGLDGGDAVGIGLAMLVRIGKVKPADDYGPTPASFYVNGPLKPAKVTIGAHIDILQMPVRLS